MINIITSFYICKLKEKNVNERNEELVESLKKKHRIPICRANTSIC